jgi:predicted  nucleic acid-binding Zn-ribbon protein
MSTLREDLDTLLTLQKLDSDFDRARKTRTTLDTGAALIHEAEAAAREADTARAAQRQTDGALKDAELEQAGIERKLKDADAKMQRATNAREAVSLEKEIAQFHRQRNALDDKILALMDETETKRESAAKAEERAKKLEQDAAARVRQMKDEAARLDASIKDLETKRCRLRETYSNQALLKRYETIRARPATGGLAIARVDGSSCGACHMQIGTQDAYHAQEAVSVTVCENCGRIMC